MHWIKKTVFGVTSMFILFILIQTFGAGLFSAEFLGIGGLMILLGFGFFETNTVTYE
jgi:hypothetical protein